MCACATRNHAHTTIIDRSIVHVFDLATMAESSRASCSAPAPKVRKTDSVEKRRFLSSWKTEFPWVVMDDDCNHMICSYCVDAKKNNSFTTGCNKFKKDPLRKHALTIDHRTALEARSARKDMQQAIANVNRSQEKAVISALKTVYFMAKRTLLTISSGI